MAKKGKEMIPFPGEMGINEFKGKQSGRFSRKGSGFSPLAMWSVQSLKPTGPPSIGQTSSAS